MNKDKKLGIQIHARKFAWDRTFPDYTETGSYEHHFKPKNAFWTSSFDPVIGSKWASHLVTEFKEGNFELNFCEVIGDPRVLTLNNNKDVEKAWKAMRPTSVTESAWKEQFSRSRFWEVASKHYDAIRTIEPDRGDLKTSFMNAWDVESTAWLRPKEFLRYIDHHPFDIPSAYDRPDSFHIAREHGPVFEKVDLIPATAKTPAVKGYIEWAKLGEFNPDSDLIDGAKDSPARRDRYHLNRALTIYDAEYRMNKLSGSRQDFRVYENGRVVPSEKALQDLVKELDGPPAKPVFSQRGHVTGKFAAVLAVGAAVVAMAMTKPDPATKPENAQPQEASSTTVLNLSRRDVGTRPEITALQGKLQKFDGP